jgi:peptide deformylase
LKLLDNLRDTLYAANGVGLAAPQIGVPKRAIVVDAGTGLYELINPVILSGEGEESQLEGCLSVPGLNGMVKRKARVVVQGIDREGQEITVEGEGLLARAFQHEIDHRERHIVPGSGRMGDQTGEVKMRLIFMGTAEFAVPSLQTDPGRS